MGTYYYADANNQTVGPYQLSQLKELSRTGVIASSTPVIAHGDSTWSNYSALVADQQPEEIADAVIRQAREFQGKVQASLEGVDGGAVFFALVLVVVHLFILPYIILRRSLGDLTAWGKASRLPSSTSDSPVLTFAFVVLRPPVILFVTFITLFCIIYSLCTGQYIPFVGAGMAASGMDVSNIITRIGIAIVQLIVGYFDIGVIAFVFDCFSLAVGIANNIKKIAERS